MEAFIVQADESLIYRHVLVGILVGFFYGVSYKNGVNTFINGVCTVSVLFEGIGLAKTNGLLNVDILGPDMDKDNNKVFFDIVWKVCVYMRILLRVNNMVLNLFFSVDYVCIR